MIVLLKQALRVRKVTVWAAFQYLSQIKKFDKPDVFLGATCRQVFANNDVQTQEWIQKLGASKTIINKTQSINSGEQKSNRLFDNSGSISHGESESINNTGTSLIHLNQINEMARDETWLFIRHQRPIKIKFKPYYKNPRYQGRYDNNPLET